MIRFWKRHKIVSLLLLALIYLLVGATAPFLSYRKIKDSTMEAFAPGRFRKGVLGVDRVALVETNQEAWEERMRLFSRAREQIILSTFDMREGKSTKDILSVLLHKAEEGVRIRILVDGISGLVRMEGKEVFYALSSHPNVEIKHYNRPNLLKPWKLQGRMHDKYVIVDEEAYLLGGRNTFDYFIGSYTKKNVSFDREVLVYNTKFQEQAEAGESSIKELTDYFETIWQQEDCTLFRDDERLAEKEKVQTARKELGEHYEKLAAKYPKLFDLSWDYSAHTYEAGSIQLLSNPIHVNAKEPVLFYELTELMGQAKERVVIQSPYVVCNSDMLERLTELEKKVPDVRLLLNTVENGDNFVASSDYLRHKDEIVATGISMFEYDGGTSNHGKSVLIDKDLSVVGSYNLDLRSTYLDTELMLVIESEELNEELGGYLSAMERDSRKVLDAEHYEIPAHLEVQQAPLWKRAAWAVFGFVMQPFRCLI